MATRFGVVGYPSSFADLREQVTAAESAGFEGWFFSEHHQRTAGYHFGSNMEAMAAAAACTSRISLGTCVLLLPLHQPVALAESTAVVDRISGGRLILGVGLGYQAEDFVALGVDLGQRVSRFEEGLAVLRQAWSEGRVTFHGRRYQFDDVIVHPRPARPPPVWIAALSGASVRRAARLGDAWLADPLHSTTALEKLRQVYGDEAARLGRQASTVLTRFVVPGTSRGQALAGGAAALTAIFGHYYRTGAFTVGLDPWMDSVRSSGHVTAEALVEDRVAVGTPEECMEQLDCWRRSLQADWLLLTFIVDFERAHEATLAALQSFGALLEKAAGGPPVRPVAGGG